MNHTLLPDCIFSPDWALQHEAHAAFLLKLRGMSAADGVTVMGKAPGEMSSTELEDWLVKRGYIHRPQMVGDVLVVPVIGVMVSECRVMQEALWGLANMSLISSWLEEALMDSKVRGIVLRVNSPGGTVLGTDDLARVVEKVGRRKPMIAVNTGMMCSAAYYACAAAGYIYTSRSALIGSIGVILQIMDVTKFYEDWGIKVETFVSGPLKGTGAAGTSLSDEQREYVQGRVDSMAVTFKTWVTGHRSGIVEDSMQGQSFYGPEGVKLGFSDGFGTLGDAIRDVVRL